MAFKIAALLMVLTACLHSYFGERRLIAPMLSIDAPLFQSALARWVIRFAWHMTSALIMLIGFVWLMAGLVDGIGSRGKHIGWPPITLAGLFILIPILIKG